MTPMTRPLPDFLRRAKTQLLPITCFTIFLMSSSPTQSFAAGWERVASLPEPNGGFLCGDINGEVVIAGGTNWKNDAKHWLSGIHAYNPATDQWRQIGTLDAPLAYGVSGQDAQVLWFASGSSGTNTHRSILKIDKGLAASRAPALDTGFVYAAGAIIGPTLYVLGGADDQASLEKATNALLAIDLGTGTVTRLPAYPEPAFVTGAAAACAGRLFAFGGARWDTEAKTVANLSSAHAYFPAEKRWEKLRPLPYAVRGITAVALDDRHILLAGGYKDDATGFVTDALLYDTQSGEYAPTTPLPYAAMVSFVKSGDWLYCLGGEDKKKHRTDAVFRIKWKELLKQ
jgi:N-acetylneuraminic acid mutarotase